MSFWIVDFYAVLSFFTILVMLGLGAILCFKLRFVHILGIPKAIKGLSIGGNTMSSFAALFSVVGGNLGVGNISGVAVAMAAGGPGSVIWMCAVTFIVGIIKYACCILGVHYREINADGKSHEGGAMYCLKYAADNRFSKPWASYFANGLAYTYVVLVVLGGMIIGNLIQVNSIAVAFSGFEVSGLIIGLLMAFLIYKVSGGGLGSFAKASSILVPFMALFYLIVCLIVIFVHSEMVPGALRVMLKSAFDIEAVGAASIWTAFNVGALKAILATDVGLGLESIIHSKVKNPGKDSFAVEQGLISSLSPLFVMLFIFITGMTFMVTDAWLDRAASSSSMVIMAFSAGVGREFSVYFVPLILFLFAFTTILTWMFCSERALMYLVKDIRWFTFWRWFFLVLIPFGSIMKVDLVWNLADVIVPLMLIPNIAVIIIFFNDIIRLTKNSKERLHHSLDSHKIN